MQEKDIHFLASNLLESLANSVYERDSSKFVGFPLFSINEIQVVERWMKEFIKAYG